MEAYESRIELCLERMVSIMNCTLEQFEEVLAKFKYFAESVNVQLSSESEGLRQELVVVCAELLATVREEVEAGADSIV